VARKTRGDYWVLDIASGSPASSATRPSPRSRSRSSLRTGAGSTSAERAASRTSERRDHPVSSDGSRTTINGTFDWVYEEELGLQDGWRWSPDGERIAYWQLDATGVREFLLINTTDSLYSFTTPVQYPKAGETNSAGRVGVVPAAGGPTRWMAVPGDPRQNYIARMDWAASPDEIVMQRLNRLQNTLEIMLGDASSGQVRTIRTERDSAWVDMRVELMEWLDDGDEFAWISEADGWRHVYVISRDGTSGGSSRGDFDVLGVVSVDEEDGWLYYLASPDDPIRGICFDRASTAQGTQAVTPGDAAGWHAYDAAPGAEWAFTSIPCSHRPPRIRAPPDHRCSGSWREPGVSRQDRRARAQAVEFFRVDQGDGVMIDG
jgi:dipeptidyl-peptidase-4